MPTTQLHQHTAQPAATARRSIRISSRPSSAPACQPAARTWLLFTTPTPAEAQWDDGIAVRSTTTAFVGDAVHDVRLVSTPGGVVPSRSTGVMVLRGRGCCCGGGAGSGAGLAQRRQVRPGPLDVQRGCRWAMGCGLRQAGEASRATQSTLGLKILRRMGLSLTALLVPACGSAAGAAAPAARAVSAGRGGSGGGARIALRRGGSRGVMRRAFARA
jgi:hypothetical protein